MRHNFRGSGEAVMLRCRNTARTIDRDLIGVGCVGQLGLTCENGKSRIGSRWTFADELRTSCGLNTHHVSCQICLCDRQVNR
jgi:hypothetical protein